MDDSTTSVQLLRQWVADFVAARQWEKFHTPKNLAMSVAIEAAELMEHFQWVKSEQIGTLMKDPERRESIADEMADVLYYVLALANQLQIDLTSAFCAKMKKNESKYPAERIRGRYGYDDLEAE